MDFETDISHEVAGEIMFNFYVSKSVSEYVSKSVSKYVSKSFSNLVY